MDYNCVIMSPMASQITGASMVYSTVYSDADHRDKYSSASLAFVRRIHRWPVNSPHKGPVTRRMFPIDDVIMRKRSLSSQGLILVYPSLLLYMIYPYVTNCVISVNFSQNTNIYFRSNAYMLHKSFFHSHSPGGNQTRNCRPGGVHWVVLDSANSLSLVGHLAITWTEVELIWIGPLTTHLSENNIKIRSISFTNIEWKLLSTKCHPFSQSSIRIEETLFC